MKFSKLSKLILSESPDGTEGEFQHEPFDENAVTFSIIADGIIHNDYAMSGMFTHHEMAESLRQYVRGEYEESKFDYLGEFPSKEQITGRVGTDIGYLGARMLMDVAGRLWMLGDGEGVISFWVRSNDINNKQWGLIRELMEMYEINPQQTHYQFVDMHNDEYVDHDYVFGASEKEERTSTKSDEEIAKLKAKAHVIGGKWAAAIRKL
tara:strand:+ start:15151 stop:15774 length:624 start_codon:yes stop_codon:yes gene_type:complete